MIDILRSRRSVRKFRKDKIEANSISILKETVLRSPTSRNRKAWKFWFVTDKLILKKLSESKKAGSQFIKDAPLAVVIGGDESLTDMVVEDCSIASINIQNIAVSLGLGSCWVQIRKRFTASNESSQVYLQRILETPPTIKFESIIVIGKPNEDRAPIPFGDLDFSVITDI